MGTRKEGIGEREEVRGNGRNEGTKDSIVYISKTM
jgi:hypothetical protein